MSVETRPSEPCSGSAGLRIALRDLSIKLQEHSDSCFGPRPVGWADLEMQVQPTLQPKTRIPAQIPKRYKSSQSRFLSGVCSGYMPGTREAHKEVDGPGSWTLEGAIGARRRKLVAEWKSHRRDSHHNILCRVAGLVTTDMPVSGVNIPLPFPDHFSCARWVIDLVESNFALRYGDEH